MSQPLLTEGPEGEREGGREGGRKREGGQTQWRREKVGTVRQLRPVAHRVG